VPLPPVTTAELADDVVEGPT